MTKEKIISSIIDSIYHWTHDIVEPLAYDTIDKDRMIWKSSGLDVRYTSTYCSLCKLCYDSKKAKKNCKACPYYKFFEIRCDDPDGDWELFINNPCRKTAISMRNALIEVLNYYLAYN